MLEEEFIGRIYHVKLVIETIYFTDNLSCNVKIVRKNI